MRHAKLRPMSGLLLCGVLVAGGLMACGTTSSSPAANSPSTGSVSPTPVACTSSGAASPTWPAPDKLPATAAITSVSASGDVLTMTFAEGTPAFEVATQSNTRFTADPSGQPVNLTGIAGVHITLRGFRGDVQNYSASRTLTSQGPILLQVRELGDTEGVVTWGAGVSTAACAVAAATGSTLTFTFVRQPAA